MALFGNDKKKKAAIKHLNLEKNDTGEAKFLEYIVVYLKIKAPRKFWAQYDTYRIGVTKHSESTMHTILKRQQSLSDYELFFGYDNDDPEVIAENEKDLAVMMPLLERMEEIRISKPKNARDRMKNLMPESYYQTRYIKTDLKSIIYMYMQRKGHALKEWQWLCERLDRIIQTIKDGFERAITEPRNLLSNINDPLLFGLGVMHTEQMFPIDWENIPYTEKIRSERIKMKAKQELTDKLNEESERRKLYMAEKALEDMGKFRVE